MKRTTNGFEKRTAPSTAKHPDFQRGEQFNGTINPLGNKLAKLPKQELATCSWWLDTDRETFRVRQAEEQKRLSRVSLSTPHKDAI